jgi:hypothetical protein
MFICHVGVSLRTSNTLSSATDQLLQVSWIPGVLHFDFAEYDLNLAQIAGRPVHIRSTVVLFEPVQLRGSRIGTIQGF